MATYLPSHRLSKKDEQDMLGTKNKFISDILLWILQMDTLVLTNQHALRIISFLQTLGVILRTKYDGW